MFTKLEHRSWIKSEVVGRRSTQECFLALREACAHASLPYRTVVRWVKVFRDSVQDKLLTGRPHVQNNTDQLPASLLDADR